MTTPRSRWDGDERGRGIAYGTAHAPHVCRLLEAMASPGWVAEDPDAHLLPTLGSACREAGSPWTLLSTRLDGAVFEVALAWDREGSGIGRLRADVNALIGSVAEGSGHVRQHMTDGEIRYEVTTGMLDGDSGFSGHGHRSRRVGGAVSTSPNAGPRAAYARWGAGHSLWGIREGIRSPRHVRIGPGARAYLPRLQGR